MIVAKRSVYLGGSQKMAEKKKESFQFEHKVKQVFFALCRTFDTLLLHSTVWNMYLETLCNAEGFFHAWTFNPWSIAESWNTPSPKENDHFAKYVLEKLPRGSQLTRSSRIHVQANDFITFMYTEALNCIVLHDVERFPKMWSFRL